MAIGHVKPAGVTGIPIGVTFEDIGKWRLHRPLDAWCVRIPAATTVSSNHPNSCGRTVWRDTACGITLESTWHANGAGRRAWKSTKLGPTIVEHWSDTCNWSNTCIGGDLSMALKTTTALRVTTTPPRPPNRPIPRPVLLTLNAMLFNPLMIWCKVACVVSCALARCANCISWHCTIVAAVEAVS